MLLCGIRPANNTTRCSGLSKLAKLAKISKLLKLKSKGSILEVDVRYPKTLHDSHNDLPFMCEKMKIDGVEKLIPNLYDKKRYVIHIRALDQVLKHGLVLECIHRAIEFKQSA